MKVQHGTSVRKKQSKVVPTLFDWARVGTKQSSREGRKGRGEGALVIILRCIYIPVVAFKS